MAADRRPHDLPACSTLDRVLSGGAGIEVTATFSRRRVAVAWLILAACALVYVVRGYHDQRLTLQSMDFKTVYGSARCMLKGCDPYDSEQIATAYLHAGGVADDMRAFRPHEPVYLPSALAVSSPFALLPWAPAHLLWLAVSTGVFLIGAAVIASLSFRYAPLISAVGIGLLLLTSTMLMMLAQPAQLAIGLCAIAVWSLLEDRSRTIGILCFATALTFKPHVTGLVWLYFALSKGRYRRQALRILVVTVLLSLPGVLWASLMPASRHWLHEISANVAALSLQGMVNDPGPANPEATGFTNLQSIFCLMRDEPGFYNRAAEMMGMLFLGAWGIAFVRMAPSRERDYLGIAAMTCISFLPIYHRDYDTGLLLLVFPAFAMLVRAGSWRRNSAAGVTLVALPMLTHLFHTFVILHVLPGLQAPRLWQTIFWLRPVALWMTVLASFYLGCFLVPPKRKPAGAAAELPTA